MTTRVSKQNVNITCYYIMTKPANSKDKPSPADTPTHRPNDNGHKSKVRSEDRQYHADEPHGGDIAKKHEREEQPVGPGKEAHWQLKTANYLAIPVELNCRS
jgi:hypothetical protein